MILAEVKILTAGEQGIVVEFGNVICAEINAKVHKTAQRVEQELSEWVREVVPTYRSVLVYFDPLQVKRQVLVDKIREILSVVEDDSSVNHEKTVLHVPVCYEGEFAPDLAFVAEHNGLSSAEVVAIHTSVPYLIYMLGFTPGFPYLGGMSERIAAPRLSQPRTVIPAGSVGIAGSQTGLYPVESPGGWRLIGRTPIKPFDPAAKQPFLLKAGMYLQFTAISAAEYAAIAAQVADGTYEVRCTRVTKEETLC